MLSEDAEREENRFLSREFLSERSYLKGDCRLPDLQNQGCLLLKFQEFLERRRRIAFVFMS